jgi:hypothetical protein
LLRRDGCRSFLAPSTTMRHNQGRGGG